MARGAKRSDDDDDGSQMSGMPPRAPSRLKKRGSSYKKGGGNGAAHGGGRSGWALIWIVAFGGIFGLLVYSWRTLVPRAQIVESQRRMPTPVVLEHHCKEHIGYVVVFYSIACMHLCEIESGLIIRLGVLPAFPHTLSSLPPSLVPLHPPPQSGRRASSA